MRLLSSHKCNALRRITSSRRLWSVPSHQIFNVGSVTARNIRTANQSLYSYSTIPTPYPNQQFKKDYAAFSSQCNSITAPQTPPAANNDSLTLHDSLSSTPKPIETSTPKDLAWYTCGPTVYDSTHLGHARTYVNLDIIRRLMTHTAAESSNLLFIMNITDVDDKIINRADELQIHPLELAKQYEKEFFEDLRSLNVLPPSVVTRVSEYIPDIIAYITQIMNNKCAYVVSDPNGNGGVYFDTKEFEHQAGGMTKYGKLAPNSQQTEEFFPWENQEQEQVDRDGDEQEDMKKRDARDFVLWKFRKEGEESLNWKSPWGLGRPGWHIECSAMIHSVMQTFPHHELQVHAGGIDLKFPHHTNEIAQAEAHRLNIGGGAASMSKKEWIPHWVHLGHLHISGRKMSKSLKNFITVRDMLKSGQTSCDGSGAFESPGDDFRLWCFGLSGSYRAPATYSEERLQEAKNIRQKLIRFLVDGEQWVRTSSSCNATDSKRWGDAEQKLFQSVQQCRSSMWSHLMGNDIDGSTDIRHREMNGGLALNELLSLVEMGTSYMQKEQQEKSAPNDKSNSYAIEPIQSAIFEIRQKLALVGFTEKTTCAGLVSTPFAVGLDGKNEALGDEIVRFRSLVRSIALNSSSNESLKMEILRECDTLRDVTLPAIGLEIFDSKTLNNQDDDASFTWRPIVPRKVQESDIVTSDSKKVGDSDEHNTKLDPESPVALDLLFRVGKFDGVFLDYDDTGMPTSMADGSPLSKSMLKKLKKRLLKHEKRILKKTGAAE